MPPRKTKGMFGVQINNPKKFAPHVRGQRHVMKRVGTLAAKMIRDRVDKRGRHAEGALPKVDSAPWWFASKTDPRWRAVAKRMLVERYRRGESGPRGTASLLVSLGGYRDFKRGMSGKTRRGQSLTGDMWGSIAVSLRDRGVARKEIVVGFGGSSRFRQGKGGRVRNRDKAKLLQYSERTPSGEPKGRKDFLLMALTDEELFKLRDVYLSRIKLFKQR